VAVWSSYQPGNPSQTASRYRRHDFSSRPSRQKFLENKHKPPRLQKQSQVVGLDAAARLSYLKLPDSGDRRKIDGGG
jgi:hypothetical protein